MTDVRQGRGVATIGGNVPRFYFDVSDNGQVWTDGSGEELDDFAEAREHAIALLPDLARDALPDGDHHVIECRVRDENGVVVYRGRLTFEGFGTGGRPVEP